MKRVEENQNEEILLNKKYENEVANYDEDAYEEGEEGEELEDNKLIKAIRKKQMNDVYNLIDSNNVNETGQYGYTAAMWAARLGKLDLLKALLDSGADINVQEVAYGSSALIIACQEGRTEAAKLLIEKGADCNIANKYGLTALHYAARSNLHEVVSILVKQDNIDINALSACEDTPLIEAAVNSSFDAALVLVEAGAKVGIVGHGNATALWDALSPNCTPINPKFLVRVIEKQLEEEKDEAILNSLSKKCKGTVKELLHPDDLNYILKAAITFGMNIEGIKKLVEFGADVMYVDKESNSLLHHVCYTNNPHKDVIKFLLQDLNPEYENANNQSPLDYALANDYVSFETVGMLKGASIWSQIHQELLTNQQLLIGDANLNQDDN